MVDFQALIHAVKELDEKKVFDILDKFVATNPSIQEANQLVSACQQGMSLVGDLFEKNEYFIADLIFASELVTVAIDKLKPTLGKSSKKSAGTIVIGTVKGDLHNIGKNIFKCMAETAGFEIFDLGIDTPPNAFVEKVSEVRPQIVGMSGILTLSLDSMQETVQGLINAGLRGSVKIIIGGNPVSEQASKAIGADAFTLNAAEGVRICLDWVK